jgi:HlyD family secretion protein
VARAMTKANVSGAPLSQHRYLTSLLTVPPTPMPRLRAVRRAGNILLGGFVLGLGAWSVVAPLESAAIASGIVESESSRKTIQHFEGGIVSRILVRDGDVVVAGQTLIQLDSTKARAQLAALQGQLWDAQAREARLLAERDGLDKIAFPAALLAAGGKNPAVATILAGQQKIFETRRGVLQSQITVIHERMSQVGQEIAGLQAQETAAGKRAAIIRDEITTVRMLLEKGLERRPRLLALERESVEIEGRRGDLAASISRAHQVIAESQAHLAKLQNDRHNEIAQLLRETQNHVHELVERVQAAADQLSRTEITAPEDGVVTDLRVRTPGGVIGAGAALMDLVPREDRLIINARLQPEDIDVVHPGLRAEVYLVPYKQRRAPPLKGVVTYVSADSLVDRRTDQAYFATKIRVEDKRLARLDGVEMIPGMPAQVMIKTGERTVAAYVIAPFLDSFNRAFRED